MIGPGLWIFIGAVMFFALFASVWLIYLAWAMPVPTTPHIEDPPRGIRIGLALSLPMWIVIIYFGFWMLS